MNRQVPDIMDTTHILVNSLSGIIDAWETFSRDDIELFTTYAPDALRLKWSVRLSCIKRNVSELERLRKLLLTRQEHLSRKLESVSIFSLAEMCQG
jgi:hypothetical protein